MTTFHPRHAYTQEELNLLYPRNLQLQQVQVLLRHGERTPVGPRFENAGLTPYWPYCSVARQLISMTKDPSSATWTPLKWKRQLEIFGRLDDSPEVSRGQKGEDTVCMPGELTDKGRETTWELGARLRRLYVYQLGFMPAEIKDTGDIYLRATPIPRALDSLQQAFMGMFPESSRGDFAPVSIVTRSPGDEQLYPNEESCTRLLHLMHAFAERAAERHNNTADMDYVNSRIGKWMPKASPRVKVDSRPRLSGIMDTINSTLAHGSETKLPAEFYDEKSLEIIERVGVEEWFGGFKESQEFRSLGAGSKLGDVVGRMIDNIEGSKPETDRPVRLSLQGCHDTTLAAALTSLGAFDGERWPPYTSHIAFEVFKHENAPAMTASNVTQQNSWFSGLFGAGAKNSSRIGRRTLKELSKTEKAKLDGYFVRIRYNDKVMKVPGCKAAGKHLEGDDSFCTLAEFKSIVDKFTPHHYKKACVMNLDKPAFPEKIEPAGFA